MKWKEEQLKTPWPFFSSVDSFVPFPLPVIETNPPLPGE
jgi:hypothetical protein